jgi:threonine dehydratase
MTELVSLHDIQEAAERIDALVLRTPLVPFNDADPRRPLLLKAESLQATGAFKLRGAYNKVLSVLDLARLHGVVAHSSGNHARAVAYVARALDLHAVIVMPDAAPAIKVDAVRALGAEVLLVSPEERQSKADELVAAHGYVLVPPYDDPAIVAGQGTVGLEIVVDRPDVDVVLVPVSGGGLIGGIATAVKSIRPEALVVGVEPELAADAAESLRVGRPVAWPLGDTYRTIADGLRTTPVGQVPWRQMHKYVDEVLTVSEGEILSAMKILFTNSRLVAEPSGAVAVAAYLNRVAELPETGTFVAVVSGGNVDPALYARTLLA